MKTSLSFWKNINTSEFIIDIIKSGYKIPFVNEPENIILKNNKSALDQTEFVEKAIKELSNANLIREESSRPHVVNPLTVSISSGKDRLILDLRHVSKQVRFKIINFPNMCSNIPASPADGVYISQLIRCARASSNYSDFLKRHLHLRNRLLDQGYKKIRLIRSLKKFIFRYQYLVEIYSVSAEQIISDAFSYSENV